MQQNTTEAHLPAVMPAVMTAALNVVGLTFQFASATLERPMRSVAAALWQAAMQKYGEPTRKRIMLVESDVLSSDDSGVMYYVPPELARPLDTTSAQVAYYAWLRENGVKMSRVSAQPIIISLESPVWLLGADSPVLTALQQQLQAVFASITDAIVEGLTPDEMALATMPVIVFGEQPGNPFFGVFTVSGRCGFCGLAKPA